MKWNDYERAFQDKTNLISIETLTQEITLHMEEVEQLKSQKLFKISIESSQKYPIYT